MLIGNMNPAICLSLLVLQEREMIYILWYAIYALSML